MSKIISEVLAKAKESNPISTSGKKGLSATTFKDSLPVVAISPFDKVIQSIKEGGTGTLLDFNSKKQTLDGTDYPLGDVLIRAKLKGGDTHEHLLVNKEDSLNATVCAGGEDSDQRAFLTSKGADGNEAVSELESFYSLATKTVANGELGVITSYDSKIGLNTGLIKGEANLDAVKQLLLSNAITNTDDEQPKLTSGDNNEELAE